MTRSEHEHPALRVCRNSLEDFELTDPDRDTLVCVGRARERYPRTYFE